MLANDVTLSVDLELLQGLTMRVLGISGSLRRDSYNSGLLRAAAMLLPSGPSWRCSTA
jgi:hypothetical protein